jgi:competence protein ComEA
VVVVAILAVLGLVLTCWWLVRGQGHEVIAPPAVSTVSDALATPATSRGPTAAAGASASPAAAKVVVDVTGRVRHPGIAVLRQGARVIDALHAAGGARPGVDLSGLNLARVLTDGEQVVVGAAASGVPGPAASGAPSGAPVAALVNINTADETTLESLPEIGPVTAQAIITWRTQNGAFGSVDQLLDVDGIGDATLSKLTPYVTI